MSASALNVNFSFQLTSTLQEVENSAIQKGPIYRFIGGKMIIDRDRKSHHSGEIVFKIVHLIGQTTLSSKGKYHSIGDKANVFEDFSATVLNNKEILHKIVNSGRVGFIAHTGKNGIIAKIHELACTKVPHKAPFVVFKTVSHNGEVKKMLLHKIPTLEPLSSAQYNKIADMLKNFANQKSKPLPPAPSATPLTLRGEAPVRRAGRGRGRAAPPRTASPAARTYHAGRRQMSYHQASPMNRKESIDRDAYMDVFPTDLRDFLCERLAPIHKSKIKRYYIETEGLQYADLGDISPGLKILLENELPPREKSYIKKFYLDTTPDWDTLPPVLREFLGKKPNHRQERRKESTKSKPRAVEILIYICENYFSVGYIPGHFNDILYKHRVLNVAYIDEKDYHNTKKISKIYRQHRIGLLADDKEDLVEIGFSYEFLPKIKPLITASNTLKVHIQGLASNGDTVGMIDARIKILSKPKIARVKNFIRKKQNPTRIPVPTSFSKKSTEKKDDKLGYVITVQSVEMMETFYSKSKKMEIPLDEEESISVDRNDITLRLMTKNECDAFQAKAMKE